MTRWIAGPFRGREDVLRTCARGWLRFDAFRSEPKKIIDAGERVVVAQRSHGVLKGRGNTEADVRFATVWELRDSKVVPHKQYRHLAEALNTVGVEDEAN